MIGALAEKRCLVNRSKFIYPLIEIDPVCPICHQQFEPPEATSALVGHIAAVHFPPDPEHSLFFDAEEARCGQGDGRQDKKGKAKFEV
jgi:hypothetical protein